MARKVQDYTVSSEESDNRDNGKTYVLTEMAAVAAERWALRALIALTKNGVDVPAEVTKTGFAGLVPYLTNLIGSIQWDDAEPLLAEMLTCIQIRCTLDSKGTTMVRKLTVDDIEEVSTLLLLRREVLKLHVGFLNAVSRSSWAAALRGPSPATPSPSA